MKCPLNKISLYIVAENVEFETLWKLFYEPKDAPIDTFAAMNRALKVTWTKEMAKDLWGFHGILP